MSAIVLALLALSLPSAAYGASGCSSEVLSVRGTPVTVAYCLSGPETHATGGELNLPVRATYSSPHGSFTTSRVLNFISAEGPPLVLQSVALARLGIAGTLHLTLRYDGSAIRIASAMLTPGAITIK